MGYYFDKQPGSRIIKMQNLSYTGSGTVVSTNFSPETYQVRVISQVAGQFTIDNLGTIPTTTGGNGVFLPASTTGGEYFTCTPGQILAFSSTSSSTGVISVAEMA